MAHPSEANAAELLSVLADLASDRDTSLSAREAGRRVLRRAVVAMRAAGGVARIVDRQGTIVEVVEVASTRTVPAPAAEMVARAEEAWLATAAEIRTRFPGSTPADLGALASLRLEAEHQPASGVAFWFQQERAFTDVERTFLAGLGHMLAQEVDRAGLLERRRTDAHEREKMIRWADVLSDSFQLIFSRASLQHILDELARVSCETPADFAAIRVLSADRQSLEFRALHHRNPIQGDVLRQSLAGALPASLGETARVLETGKSLLIPNIDMARALRTYGGTPFGDYIARFPISTAMVVRLASRGSVFGVVTVTRSDPDPFQPADLRYLEEVADRAAAALDNANLLEQLTRSEEKLRVALEAGQLGTWDWDIRGGQVGWSTMLERIHGLDPGAFGGTFEAYQRDIHPDDRPQVLATIARAVEDRTDHHVAYRIVRPDGELRWMEAHGRLFCDPSGAPQRLVGVCTDITERRKSEEQLQQMVVALRDADQRKDNFLAMLAHELRNPLAPMVNATYLLGIPELQPEMAARAREILARQVQHMAHLLDDLLDVSRITRGKIDLVREAVDVCALVREVADDHLEAFRAAGLVLEVTVSDEPLVVHGDRARLAQIVGNLLSNSLKFSLPGQPVSLSAERDASSLGVALTVRDHGVGIEPSALDRIFEPFVQADTSLSRAQGGLGLGLAVVKGLVALHGGRVSAASAGPGHGAELRVLLPLQPVPVDARAPARSEPESPSGASAMVLVLEDNTDAAESLRALLSAAGYRVWVEPTGREATEVVKRVQPAIVLCDIGLPDKDGYEVAADIRAQSDLAPLPLIAISGYGAAEDQARARRAGFDLHLTKPVSPKLLLSELSRRIPRPGS